MDVHLAEATIIDVSVVTRPLRRFFRIGSGCLLLAIGRFRRTSRNPCCSTRAISLSRCWQSIERAPPTLGSRREAVDVAAKRRSGLT
jgi:hypothetical protein